MVLSMTKEPDPLLGSAEVCAELDIDRSTLSRWVASGRIEPIQRLSSGFLFTRAAVDRALKTMETSA
jgi:predicted site-specific integrase-resolvase